MISFVTYLWNNPRMYKYKMTLVVYFETAGLLIGPTHLCNVFDFATSCNYITLSLSTHTGCRMHIRFCAIISSIFYVCDVVVVEICPHKVANLQLWSTNFKWNWVPGIFMFTIITRNDIRVNSLTVLVPRPVFRLDPNFVRLPSGQNCSL